MASITDDMYECTLTPESEAKAKEELNEDPKNRMGAVETLREWVVQQKHMTSPTDTKFLLKFLRTSKFSQLRARQMLENYLSMVTDNPTWYINLDFQDPEIIAALKTGFVIPLPGYDSQGRKMMLAREAAVPASYLSDKTKKIALIKASMGVIQHALLDENVQVNGITYFVDFSHMSMSHLTAWGMDEIKQSMRFQDSFPARFKGLHYYNTGAVFETMFELIKPLMKAKLKGRIKVHGTNLENLYEYFPKSSLPEEYLPDDYDGPKAGTMADIIKNVLNELQRPETRDRLLYETKSDWKLDKKMKENLPNESFRKLNVD